ncbi:unnamed protein product [Ilex paraguariensis]|uniref:Phytocyanin domain-containing protein n=1 Tax=Ilex paraguariensis TaxID=185542 RepID=A0ABC8RV71_9AQUA
MTAHSSPFPSYKSQNATIFSSSPLLLLCFAPSADSKHISLMASFPATSNNAFNLVLLSPLLLISISTVLVSSFQFQVGGERGWEKPTTNETETYNHWASKNRFHVGDTIYFKYQRDSVLVVNSTGYRYCISSNPIFKFEDGNTVFQLDHSGFFYFISGQSGHCKAGQKLIIDVIHDTETSPSEPAPEPPESAPSPIACGGNGGGGDGWDSDDWGPPGLGLNSTTKLSVASYFMTAFGAVFVILYLFMN